MLKASLELNRALEGLVDISDSLGSLEESKVCDINGEAAIRASIRFLRCYEMCIRIDEALGDIMRHKGSGELERSLDRTKVLLKELVKEINSFKTKERRMLLTYMGDDFAKYQKKLAEILDKRPADRIWDGKGIIEVTEDLSKAVGSIRKSTGFIVVILSAPEEVEKHFGKLSC